MAVNANYDNLLTTTLEARTKNLADNITKNNALLSRLKQKGNMKNVDGGTKIVEEIEYAEGDAIWYNGYDKITYTDKQLFSAAEYAWKLMAVPVAISGEEQLKNSGQERMIDLLGAKVSNAEKTMLNQMSKALYGDGTGKTIGGLKLLIADSPATGTVGGINRATSGNEFWRNQAITATAALTKDTIKKSMHDLYLKCSRGTDKPDLIVASDDMYTLYNESLVDLQRFSDPKMANAGFETLKFKGADVIYDGGIGGYCPEKHMYFLNTDYLRLRSHKDRNMKVIGGNRMAIDQDALYKIIGWAGNLTMSNAQLQGVLVDYSAD